MSTQKELMRAIKKMCLQCCAGSQKKVDECTITSCPLHKYRGKERAISTLQNAIRKNCLDCMGGNRKEVDACVAVQCPQYPYRKGQTLK